MIFFSLLRLPSRRFCSAAGFIVSLISLTRLPDGLERRRRRRLSRLITPADVATQLQRWLETTAATSHKAADGGDGGGGGDASPAPSRPFAESPNVGGGGAACQLRLVATAAAGRPFLPPPCPPASLIFPTPLFPAATRCDLRVVGMSSLLR